MRPPTSGTFSPQLARMGGWLYLGIIVGGLYAEAFVRSRLITSGDAGKTAQAILNNEPLYRSGLAADMLVLACDVGVAAVFYQMLKPTSLTLSLMAASFRLVMVGIAGANALNHAGALSLLKNASGMGSFSQTQLEELALQSLRMHGNMYSISLIFFGLSCVLTGYLLMRSRLVPPWIGAALIVAGVCYLGSSSVRILWPQGTAHIFPAAFIPPLIAEVSLTLWLIWRGVKTQEPRLREA